jgi:hypothetical protein
MQRAEITLPDRRRVEITFETQDQLNAAIASLTASPRPRGSVDLGPPASPVAGQSFGRNMIQGVGASLSALGRGARQVGTEALEAMTPFDTLVRRGSGQPLRSDVLRQREADIRDLERPLMATGGGATGRIASDIGVGIAGARYMPGSQTEWGAARLGGLFGATKPLDANENRAESTLRDASLAVAGREVGNALSARFQRPAPPAAPTTPSASASASSTGGQAGSNTTVQANPTLRVTQSSGPGQMGPAPEAGLTQAQRDALGRGTGVGMRATPGVATGNKVLQQFEAKLESQPVTSAPFFDIKDTNQRVVTRQFLRAIGEGGDEASQGVMANARERIGQQFDEILARNEIPYTPQLETRLAEIQRQAGNEMPSGPMQVINKQLDEVLSRAARDGETIRGDAYQRMREGLNRLVKRDDSTGYWAGQIRDALDEALEASARPGDAARLKTARAQWRILETAMNRQGAINTDSGLVSPVALSAAFEQSDKIGRRLGGTQNAFYDSLAFVRAFPRIVGDSGTATRSPASVTDAVLAFPFSLASRAYASAPSVNLATNVQGAASVMGPAARRFGAQVGPYLPPTLTGVTPMALDLPGLLGPYPKKQ